MQCPHCLQHFFSRPRHIDLGPCGEDKWAITLETCPNCNDAVVVLSRLRPLGIREIRMVYPPSPARVPVSDDVPAVFAQDYREAVVLLPDSPKASAALGRRCLRGLLHHVGFCAANLSTEIDTLLASKQLPGYLAEAVDALREIGKFATNSPKSTHAGEIQDVEAGEAEWLLSLLEGLFEHYFLQPAELKKKRDEMLTRLNVAWKNA